MQEQCDMRERSEYTWFSLLRKQKQIPMDLLLTFCYRNSRG